MEGMLMIVFVVFGIVMFIAIGSGRENKIQEKVREMGGEVITIERRNFFTGIGPFMVVGKGRVIYRFEYRIGSQVMEGWVRFGGLFGPDWRL